MGLREEYASSDARRESLRHWTTHHDERRSHSALGTGHPSARVREVTGLNSWHNGPPATADPAGPGTHQRRFGTSRLRRLVYCQVLVQLDQVAASRRERLDISSQTLPGLLRVLLIFGAISFIVLSYPTTVDDRLKKMAITGSITAFTSFAYLLTIVFDFPFSGALAVSNSSFMGGDLAIYGASSPPEVLRPADVATLRPSDVVGVWTSAGFGPTVFREVDGEIRGALRLARGTVVARMSGNVLRGTWCEEPTRALPNKRGQVEWRMSKSGGRDHLVGAWRYGASGPMRGGWDLTRIGGREFEQPDVTPLFDQASAFCPTVAAPAGAPPTPRAPSPVIARPHR